jgi:hypothetical protein
MKLLFFRLREGPEVRHRRSALLRWALRTTSAGILPFHASGTRLRRSDDSDVLVDKDPGFVIDLIKWRLLLAGADVHGVLIHGRVVHHDRETEDKTFLGDGSDFSGCDVRGATDCERQHCGESCSG